MKNLSLLLPCCLLVLLAGTVQAVVRSSTAYSTNIEALDAGGGAPGSAGYAQSVTSIGLIGGVQSSAAYNGHTGYVPQTGGSAAIGPAGGTMTLAPASPFEPSTALTVSFSGWHDDDLPLSYAVLIDNVVVSAQGGSTVRSITGPSTPGTYTLKGRIYDALGGYTDVTQGFMVNNPQQTWRQQYFGTTGNTGSAADLADPDGDGLTNVGEWAFGTDPNVNGSGVILVSGGVITQRGTPTVRVQNVPNSVDFRAVFGRRKNHSAAGLTYMVEFSGDLISWQSSTTTPSVIADDGEIEAVTVPYPFFVNGKKARFFRVSVSISP